MLLGDCMQRASILMFISYAILRIGPLHCDFVLTYSALSVSKSRGRICCTPGMDKHIAKLVRFVVQTLC